MGFFEQCNGGTVAVLKLNAGTSYADFAARLNKVHSNGLIHLEHFDRILKNKTAVPGLNNKCYWIRIVDGLIVFAPRFGVHPVFGEPGNYPCRKFANDNDGRLACKAAIEKFLDMVQQRDQEVVDAIEKCSARIKASRL